MTKTFFIILLSCIGSLSSVWASTPSATETIFVVYNSDVDSDVTLEDEKARLQNIDRTRDFFHFFDQKIIVKEVALSNLSELSSNIERELGDSLLRGFVFLGHGNETVYALSNKEMYQGGVMARLLFPIIASERVSDKMLIYFSGCSMAGKIGTQNSFQEDFVEKVSEQLVSSQSSRSVDVIAHMYTNDLMRGGLFKPTMIDRFFIKSKIGSFFERYSMSFGKLFGAYSPTIANMLPIAVAAAVNHFDLIPNHDLIMGFAFGSIVLQRVAVKAINGFGKLINGRAEKVDFIYNLLSGSLASGQSCGDSLRQLSEKVE